MRKLKRGVTPGPFIESVFLDRSRIYDPKHYAFNLPSLRNFSKLDLNPRVTFFVGENGSGKSTLLEAIAIANGLNPEGGSRNMEFATRESHSEFHKALKVRRYHALVPDAWFMRAESLFNVATEIENLGVQNSYGSRSLHEQSHGEAFMSLVESRFSQGLYFLDEPEAALSPTTTGIPGFAPQPCPPRFAIGHRYTLADHHELSTSHDLFVQRKRYFSCGL